jgi:energy-coupling factor transporter transmembrane protein EcfT
MRLNWLVVLITTSVCIVSLFRNTHWLTDLIGGLFIGGALLVAVIAVDRFVPSQKQPS